MIITSLRDMEPFALAVDARTGAECALFEPYWSNDDRFPVRCVTNGRMGAGRVVGKQHLVSVVPFRGKECIASKYGLS